MSAPSHSSSASYHILYLVSSTLFLYTRLTAVSPLPPSPVANLPPLCHGPPRKPKGGGGEICTKSGYWGVQAKASPTPTPPPPTSTYPVVCKASLQKGGNPVVTQPCSGHSPACRQQKPALLRAVHTTPSHSASRSLNRIPLRP